MTTTLLELLIAAKNGAISHLNLPSLVCQFLFQILLLIKDSKGRYWKNNVFFRFLYYCPYFTLVGRGIRKINQYSLSKCSLTGPMVGVLEEIEQFPYPGNIFSWLPLLVLFMMFLIIIQTSPLK